MKKIFLLLLIAFFNSALSQDLDNILGTQKNGEYCRSDYECASLCCHTENGECAPHEPRGSNPQFCAKVEGEQCVTNEFCKTYAVVVCKIVKSGIKADGTMACSLRCPSVITHGSCINMVCVAPETPPVPEFDPTDCSKAVDP